MRLRNDRREQRRRVAEVRNAEWRALSVEEQIASLDQRDVRACRQREKLFHASKAV
jgi:hypothetical protein